MLRFGIICEVNRETGFARVELDEDGITTAFLPVVVPVALSDKSLQMPAINERVSVLLDEHAEQGVILGAIYSGNIKPTPFAEGESGIIRSDGSKILHNKNTGVSTFEGVSSVAIKTHTESLASILLDLLTQLTQETHPTPSGPSGVPVNAPAYQAIKLRIEAFLTS